MSFANTIQNWLAADGIPYMYASNINLNTNVPVNLPGPALGSVFALKPRSGYVRVKQNSTKVNCNFKLGAITATDGTNTVNIYNGDTNYTSNNLYYDSYFTFWYDFAISNINVTNILAQNNTATFDVEVAGMY